MKFLLALRNKYLDWHNLKKSKDKMRLIAELPFKIHKEPHAILLFANAHGVRQAEMKSSNPNMNLSNLWLNVWVEDWLAKKIPTKEIKALETRLKHDICFN